VVKKGLPVGSASQYHDPPLLEVPKGPSADELLAHRRDFYSTEDPRRLAELLERLLHGTGVNNGSQHPHVIGRVSGYVASLGEALSPKEITSADHDGNLRSQLADIRYPLGNRNQGGAVNSKLTRLAKALARKLQQHTMIFALCHFHEPKIRNQISNYHNCRITFGESH